MKKKIFLVLFMLAEIGFGFLLLFTLGRNLKLENPVSFNLGETDWVNVIASVIGILVTIILYRLGKKQEEKKAPAIVITGGSPQINLAENSRNIQATTYHENSDPKKRDSNWRGDHET